VATLLVIGDVVGRLGRSVIRELMPQLREQYRPILVIANGENAKNGIGISPDAADELFLYGVDVITSGNHIWKKRAIFEYLDVNPALLRPANYPPETPGSGLYVAHTDQGDVAVINLQGRVFMSPIDCPFRVCDALLESLEREVKIRVIDFHAEATSEKQALGWYVNGRVSLVAGTHTHVQTADERILDRGTGYISDIGMTGTAASIIGMTREVALRRFLTGIPETFQVAKGERELQGIVADIDAETGECTSIRRLQVPV